MMGQEVHKEEWEDVYAAQIALPRRSSPSS